MGVSTLAAVTLEILPSNISHDRVVSEIAQNGIDRLVHAVRTGQLDYDVYYRTMPIELAKHRAASVLDAPWLKGQPTRDVRKSARGRGTSSSSWRKASAASSSACSVTPSAGPARLRSLEPRGGSPDEPDRDRQPHRPRSRGNVVLHGAAPRLRGAEAHEERHGRDARRRLPGRRVPNRVRLRRLGPLRRHEAVPASNGFDEFIERDAYPDDAFRTIWGVADEFIFAKALARQQAAHDAGERLFMTILTVSNHRPFAVPQRDTGWKADLKSRDSAVAYADWALSDYLDKAKSAGLLDHTIVLIEGDHGARVYGAQEIPTPSYRIPGLFLVPDAVGRDGASTGSRPRSTSGPRFSP
jgi:hypothetical protein